MTRIRPALPALALLVLAACGTDDIIVVPDDALAAEAGDAPGGGELGADAAPTDASVAATDGPADAAPIDFGTSDDWSAPWDALDAATDEVDAATQDGDAAGEEVDATTSDGDAGAVEVDAASGDGDAGAVEVDAASSDGDAASDEVDAAPSDGDAAVAEVDAAPSDGDASVEEVDATSKDGDAVVEEAGPTATDGDSASGDGDTSDTGDVAIPDSGPAPECATAADCATKGAPGTCKVWACTAGTCASVATGDGAACTDGVACTVGDACKAGLCAGAAKTCDDSKPCTADACQAATGTCAHLPTAGFCDDGDACTVADACKDGGCAGGAAKACDDGNPCTKDACVAGACAATPQAGPCDAGTVCAGSGICDAGKCKAGAPIGCDDVNACTDDGCDAKTGCTHAANTATCALADACLLGQCKDAKCNAGSKIGCEDGNPCTSDACDAKKGCVYTALTDATACGVKDACSAAPACSKGVCVPSAKASCDDTNPCTDDACNPALGCTWMPNKAACEDDDLCTAKGTCSNGKCLTGVPIDPKTCDDGNACTNDTCAAKTGCTHAPNTAACNDGTPCTTGEACSGGSCQGGKPSLCDDEKECTVDKCDAKSGDCSWTAKSGPCSDGDACTVGDVCQVVTCMSGTSKVCDDNEPCTVDACDSKTGNCVAPPLPGAGAAACDGTVVGGRCMKAFAANVTWPAANQACIAWGGELVRIDSAAENASVRALGNAACGNGTSTWIGLSDQAAEGKPVWADGKAPTYLNWGQGQPDNCVNCCSVAGAGEDVVHMQANGTWNDLCVATPQPCRVCQRPSPTVACGDPIKCTAKGTCVAGICTGAVVNCDDGNPCTTDACDAKTGCKSAALGDGSACGGNGGTCTAGKCSPGADASTAVASCAALKKAVAGAKDGLYWIDTDGPGTTVPLQTQCNMGLGGGGWTLVAIASDDGVNSWTWNARLLWSTSTAVFGSAAAPTKDFKSALLHTLPFADVLFVHQPSAVWAAYHAVGDGKQSFAGKNVAVGGPVCYTPAQGWKLSAGTLTQGGKLCSTNLYINPDDHDGKATCGDNDKAWGPAWSGDTNNGCPFDDPGLSGSLGPWEGSPEQESPASGFGIGLGLNKGKAGAGENRIGVYVR